MLSSWLPTWLSSEVPVVTSSEVPIETSTSVPQAPPLTIPTSATETLPESPIIISPQGAVVIAIESPPPSPSKEDSPPEGSSPATQETIVSTEVHAVLDSVTEAVPMPMEETFLSAEANTAIERDSQTVEREEEEPSSTTDSQTIEKEEASPSIPTLPLTDSPQGVAPHTSWIPPSPTRQESGIKSGQQARDPMAYVNFPYAPKNATTTVTFSACPPIKMEITPIPEEKHDITSIIEELEDEIEEMLAPTMESSTQTPPLMVLGHAIAKTGTGTGTGTETETDQELVASCLDAMGLEGTDFCRQLQNLSCLMVGSFPLQCLLGEYYVGSDINIFCSQAPEYYAFTSWLAHAHQVEGDWKLINLPFVTMSKKYQMTNDTCVNVVLIACDNLQQYVNLTADLSFSKTTFDGYKLHCDPLSLRKVGVIGNLDVCQGMPLSNIVRRIQKYQKRGYIIIDADQFIDAYYGVYPNKPKLD